MFPAHCDRSTPSFPRMRCYGFGQQTCADQAWAVAGRSQALREEVRTAMHAIQTSMNHSAAGISNTGGVNGNSGGNMSGANGAGNTLGGGNGSGSR